MTEEQIGNYKERLLEEKLASNRSWKTWVPKIPINRTPPIPESGGNSEDDNAAEVTEYVDELSIEARLETELRDVKRH